jgi:GTP-binding protein
MNNLVLAIDGPSGSGKSSTAKALAIRANWTYLDTGALYRAATFLALRDETNNEKDLFELLQKTEIVFTCSPKDPRIFLDDIDITEEIRYQRINDSVSIYSAMPSVRQYLLELQRNYIETAPVGIVVEGRDIGTVVAPNASLKIYLYADIEQRSIRRENEVKESISTKV